MKTHLEIFKALENGLCIVKKSWIAGYLQLADDGNVIYKDDLTVDQKMGNWNIASPEDWQIKREHFDLKTAVEKSPETATLCRNATDSFYIIKKENGKISQWCDGTEECFFAVEDILANDYYILEEGEQT